VTKRPKPPPTKEQQQAAPVVAPVEVSQNHFDSCDPYSLEVNTTGKARQCRLLGVCVGGLGHFIYLIELNTNSVSEVDFSCHGSCIFSVVYYRIHIVRKMVVIVFQGPKGKIYMEKKNTLQIHPYTKGK
jgi:hypothetical protein